MINQVFVFLVHALIIMIILILLVFVIIKRGRTRNILSFFSAFMICVYLLWWITNDNRKDDLAQKYVRTYQLTHYKDCTDCILELKKDYTYRIYTNEKEYENGDWEYFDDGDISYISFDNGEELGNGNYEYIK